VNKCVICGRKCVINKISVLDHSLCPIHNPGFAVDYANEMFPKYNLIVRRVA
jgi:hypothetical protein